eukprot:1150587-Pelagomonas_calceolata.AAC.2
MGYGEYADLLVCACIQGGALKGCGARAFLVGAGPAIALISMPRRLGNRDARPQWHAYEDKTAGLVAMICMTMIHILNALCAGPGGDGPEYSFKYIAGWIERELRALLMEEDNGQTQRDNKEQTAAVQNWGVRNMLNLLKPCAVVEWLDTSTRSAQTRQQ